MYQDKDKEYIYPPIPNLDTAKAAYIKKKQEDLHHSL